MGTMTDPKEHRAAKVHRCSWCWGAIATGDVYQRYRYFCTGEAGTCKMHPECLDAMREAAHEDGGWIEWTPGQERPTPNVRGEAGTTARTKGSER